MRPNETELSHRWRKRALLRSLMLKSCKSYSSERPAVGWSDWLGPSPCELERPDNGEKLLLSLTCCCTAVEAKNLAGAKIVYRVDGEGRIPPIHEDNVRLAK